MIVSGTFGEPRLVIVVVGCSSFKQVHTTSMKSKMVSLGLGAISADCESSGTNSSRTNFLHYSSHSLFVTEGLETATTGEVSERKGLVICLQSATIVLI